MHRPLRKFEEMTVFQKELILVRDESKLPVNVTRSIKKCCWICSSTAKLEYVFKLFSMNLIFSLSKYVRYYFYNSTLETELLSHESKWLSFFMILKKKDSQASKLLRSKLQICSNCLTYFKCHVSII